MIVRPAIADDKPEILALGRKFYESMYYADFAGYDMDSAGALLDRCMESGVVLVAEHDFDLVGIVGLCIVPFMFNRDKLMACEVLWYVEPSSQMMGAGKALLAAVEPACAAAGADLIQMIHLASSPPRAGEMYEAFGYVPREHSYMKVV